MSTVVVVMPERRGDAMQSNYERDRDEDFELEVVAIPEDEVVR